MIERTKPVSERLRLIAAEPQLVEATDLEIISEAADILDELTSRLATIEAVLREFREADLDIVNANIPTRDAFARLHSAEQSVDAVLGIRNPEEDPEPTEADEPPKPRPYLTRGRRG